jgi:hypothetical protein
MDAAAHEPGRQGLHGLVSTRRVLGVLLVACVAVSLVAGVTGGLLRVGVVVPGSTGEEWAGRAAVWHAALMICGFMGTVISIERAVAARHPAAWIAPLACGTGALALLSGMQAAGAWLLAAAAAVFVAVNVLLFGRQRAPHTGLLLASAVCWLAGSLWFAAGGGAHAVLPWWFAFLVITIAAERLEMTRLMRRRPGAQPALYAILALLAVGAGVSALSPDIGGLVFGFALLALAAWLFAFDIARRTVRAEGLPRYMAVCLLTGYAWLAIGGLAWMATAAGLPARDAALHALGLGFLVSMMMGHAPVILPAVARVKLRFGAFFYVPLAALHGSLALRLFAGYAGGPARAEGALSNALALALFAATAVGAAFAWRRQEARPRRTPPRKP